MGLVQCITVGFTFMLRVDRLLCWLAASVGGLFGSGSYGYLVCVGFVDFDAGCCLVCGFGLVGVGCDVWWVSLVVWRLLGLSCCLGCFLRLFVVY